MMTSQSRDVVTIESCQSNASQLLLKTTCGHVNASNGFHIT